MDGADIGCWTPNAGAVVGLGPVAEVEHEAFFFGLDEAIASDGAMGVKKLVGDVGDEIVCPNVQNAAYGVSGW